MTDERRAFQRLNLTHPVDGAFGGVPLRIVEVSPRGVLALTAAELRAGARGLVRFCWRGEDVEAGAAVVWCEEGRAGFGFDEVPAVLHKLLEESVTEILRRQETSDGAPTIVDVDDFPVADVFVTYTVDGGVWTRRASLLPDQPANGFTIAPSEPQEHVELLCRTFEQGSAETRRLTRLFAELSVTRLPLVR
jgi:PilZ domain